MAVFPEYDWTVIKHRVGFWKGSLYNLIILLPIAIVLILISKYAAYHQDAMLPKNLFIWLILCSLALLILLNWLANIIRKGLGPHIIMYTANKDGIHVNDKITPLDQINISRAQSDFKPLELPYEQWKQPKPVDGKPLSLTIPLNTGTIELQFADEYSRQKLIRSLKDYWEFNQSS